MSVRVHSLGVRNHPYPFYDEIESGRKTIEVRVLSGYLQRISVNDEVRFTCRGTSVTCKVKDIRSYTNYEELLKSEELNKIVPGVKSVADALKIYQTFPCFQYKKPVAAFEVERLYQNTPKNWESKESKKKHRDRPY